MDLYLPGSLPGSSGASLLLINDGQLLEEMDFGSILERSYAKGIQKTVICAAIHAGEERKMEYGIATAADYMGRGARAGVYTSFIFTELLPFIHHRCQMPFFQDKSFAGFSLGGLSALDIVWSHPHEFSRVGVFSGSLWWRSRDQYEADYDDDKHRIMHQRIRHSNYQPGLKFFLQCGNKDETNDRNRNGIIDSVDDTLDLVKELKSKGYAVPGDIHYLEIPDGGHDVGTWARAMPEFLAWGWGERGIVNV